MVNKSYMTILKKLNIHRTDNDQRKNKLSERNNEFVIKPNKMIKSPVNNSLGKMNTLDDNKPGVQIDNQNNSYGNYQTNLKNPSTQKHSIREIMRKRNEDKYVNLEK